MTTERTIQTSAASASTASAGPTSAAPTSTSSDVDGVSGGLPARVALVVAAILAGLFAGFFVTYQVSVIRGLAEVDDVTYVQTFQWINRTIQTPEFAVIFFGTVPAIAFALVLNRRSGPAMTTLLGAALVFAIITIVITATANVPLNRELDVVEALTPQIAADARADFEDSWNTFNLIRTLTAFGSACCAVTAASLRRSTISIG